VRRPRWPDRTTFAPVVLPLVAGIQRRLGFVSQKESIRLAKVVFRAGGWLWNRFHWVHALEFAMMAEDLDPVHFPHWAEHLDETATALCPVCDGWTQPPLDGWFAVATTDRQDEGL
jgi:hypothetical protein